MCILGTIIAYALNMLFDMRKCIWLATDEINVRYTKIFVSKRCLYSIWYLGFSMRWALTYKCSGISGREFCIMQLFNTLRLHLWTLLHTLAVERYLLLNYINLVLYIYYLFKSPVFNIRNLNKSALCLFTRTCNVLNLYEKLW
jgi:hypothetical protein